MRLPPDEERETLAVLDEARRVIMQWDLPPDLQARFDAACKTIDETATLRQVQAVLDHVGWTPDQSNPGEGQ